MRTRWTTEEMESILIQLNNRFLPFKKYCFVQEAKGLVLLGTGGYANVYEMAKISDPEKRYAVKVLGFGEKRVDSKEFSESSQLQKDLSSFQRDVVKILDFVELRVSVDTGNQVLDVEKVSEGEEKASGGNFLKLQFVLMEKLIPVLTTDNMGRPKLYPEELAASEESEIMKLAYNIGTALARAHANNLLHRDVKLENVFYDPNKKVYKLGDFGIAKKTDDGMASTIAFTKGYGAPEVVGAVDERYDNTADIYSFGMLLYLLLNELRFPDSENYYVNVSLQYSKGYQFPYPEHDDYELCSILGGMCQYDPDDRYQSMEIVMNDIEGILIGENVRFKKNNIKAPYAAGFIFYIIGMILWKLTHMPELVLELNIWGYIFLGLSGYAFWLGLKKKEHYFLSTLILGLGIYLMISTGFTWWKLLLVLGVSGSTRSFAGLVACGGVVLDIISRVMQLYPQIYSDMQPYKWAAILALSFAMVLFIQSFVLGERDIKANSMYFKKNAYWLMVVASYGCILLSGLLSARADYQVIRMFKWIIEWHQVAIEYNFACLGLGGLVLSLIWITREYVLKKRGML